MQAKLKITTLTDRGQVSIPAHLRKALALGKGQQLLWEQVSDREMKVTVLEEPEPKGPKAMLGFAKRFRKTRTTAEWMAELRAGES